LDEADGDRPSGVADSDRQSRIVVIGILVTGILGRGSYACSSACSFLLPAGVASAAHAIVARLPRKCNIEIRLFPARRLKTPRPDGLRPQGFPAKDDGL